MQQVVDPSIEQNSEFKGNIGVLVHHATLTQCFVRCLRCWSSSPVAFRGCAPGRVRGAERATHVGSGAACATCSSWIGRSECRPRERRHLFGVSQSAHSVDEAARTRWAAQTFIRRPRQFFDGPAILRISPEMFFVLRSACARCRRASGDCVLQGAASPAPSRRRMNHLPPPSFLCFCIFPLNG